MAVGDGDDCIIKLDANIGIETLVRNRFEDCPSPNDPTPNPSVYSVCQPSSSKFAVTDEVKYFAPLDRASALPENESRPDSESGALSDISLDSDSSPQQSEKPDAKILSRPSSGLVCFPRYFNAKERIVFCLDGSAEMNETPFQTKNDQLPCLKMIKRAIHMFVQNKHFLDPKHEFSLMVMQDVAMWIYDFTSDCDKFSEALSKLPEAVECTSCDLSSALSLLIEKWPDILFGNAEVDCVYRIIFLYGRSTCPVHLSNPCAKNVIFDSPLFYFDVLYLHEVPSEKNHCVDIYEFFCNLDEHEKSFIFEMTRGVSMLHSLMGKLLSHPFQRAPQNQSNYTLHDLIPSSA